MWGEEIRGTRIGIRGRISILKFPSGLKSYNIHEEEVWVEAISVLH